MKIIISLILVLCMFTSCQKCVATNCDSTGESYAASANSYNISTYGIGGKILCDGMIDSEGGEDCVIEWK